MRRSGVRSSSAPPYPRSPTVLRWAFLCLEGQCWRHSGQLSRERCPVQSAGFALFSASLLSFFSVCLASARDPMSSSDAGLWGCGWKWRLLHRLVPLQTGHCRAAASVSHSLHCLLVLLKLELDRALNGVQRMLTGAWYGGVRP